MLDYIDKHLRPNGDMASYRKGKAPLETHIVRWQFGKRPATIGLRRFQTLQERAKQMLLSLTRSHVEQWVAQTNGILGYLSDGQFSIDLTVVVENAYNFQDCEPLTDFFKNTNTLRPLEREGFKTYVAPTERGGAMYWRKGYFFLEFDYMRLGEPAFPHKGYDLTGIHEMMHGLIGYDHCTTPECLMEALPPSKPLSRGFKQRRTKAYLCQEATTVHLSGNVTAGCAQILGWPKKEALDLRL